MIAPAQHTAIAALAALAWEAQQATPPPSESIRELIDSCWASQARLDAAQARADAALARLGTA